MTNQDTTGAPILQVRGLSKSFGGLTAVHEVDLDVPAGTIHAVIGPNGAGKTTLFSLITGELQPSSGTIRLNQTEVVGMRPHEVARLGIVRKVQQTQVFETLSVRDNILLGVLMRYRTQRKIARQHKREVSDDIDGIVEAMGLADRSNILAGSLSHGDRQRVETGMVLATGAELLLLDEPTSGLSVGERDAMAEIIFTVSKRATLLITEHDFDFIKHVADRIMVMNQGRKLLEGDVERVASDQRVRELYLGVDEEAG